MDKLEPIFGSEENDRALAEAAAAAAAGYIARQEWLESTVDPAGNNYTQPQWVKDAIANAGQPKPK